MKKLCFIVLTCFGLGFMALGAADSNVNQFKSLINDQQFNDNVGADEAVIAILKGKEGFTILTNKHKIKVDIVAGSNEKDFRLVFHKPEQRTWRDRWEKNKEKFQDFKDRVKEKVKEKHEQHAPAAR